MTSAKAWGIEARLLTPAEIKELVPFINDDILLGGYYTPSVSVRRLAADRHADAQRGRRQRARCRCSPTPRCSTSRSTTARRHDDHGRRHRPGPHRGRVRRRSRAACGARASPAMAGANIPLTPAVHQMADVGPIDILQQSGKEVAYPIVRDMDTFCYERQIGRLDGGRLVRPPADLPCTPTTSRRTRQSALSPTELPFTADDFDQQIEEAIELMDMLGEAEIKYAINGLLSASPPTPSRARRDRRGAQPVVGRRGVDQGRSRHRPAGRRVDDVRLPAPVRPARHRTSAASTRTRSTEHHIYARCAEHFNKTYGIVHPREQWASQRGMRRSPFYAREEALGAVFFDARGWERPQWYESNAKLMRAVPRRVQAACRTSGTPAGGRRSPTPSTWHMRDSVGMVDLTAFNEFDFTGPGALDYLQYMCVNNVDVAVGRSVYTPLLTPHGGFRGDLTIHAPRRATTSASSPARSTAAATTYWFTPLPADATDRSRSPTRPPASARSACGVPNAEATMAKIVTDQSKPYDVSPGRLPLRRGARGADRRRPVHDVPHLLRRRERLGDLHQHGARPARCGTPSPRPAKSSASSPSASACTP